MSAAARPLLRLDLDDPDPPPLERPAWLVAEVAHRRALDARFEPSSERGGRVRCVICGRVGYLHGRWTETCLRPHDVPCPRGCGRLYPNKAGAASHGRHCTRDAASSVPA